MRSSSSPVLTFLCFLAIALPWHITADWFPIHSYVNELATFIGWAILLLVLGSQMQARAWNHRLYAYLGCLAVLVGAALLQLVSGHTQQIAQVLQLLYFLFAAALVACVAFYLPHGPELDKIIDSWCWAWLLGCAMGVVEALCQYLQIGGLGPLVAQLTELGRVTGNIRQPNHFATLMALGMPCVAWLLQRRKMKILLAVPVATAIALAVLMSSSRTGQMILVWMIVCFLLRRTTRTLAAVLIAVSLALYIFLWWADAAHVMPYFAVHRPGLDQLLATKSNESRWLLWRAVIALITQNPFAGSGFGQLQFYAVLSDLPIRFNQLYNNAHSLPLQIAVEFGLPAAVAFFALLAYALHGTRASFTDAVGAFSVSSLGAILIHSLSEFPLWYAFFLLPFSFYTGLWIAQFSSEAEAQASQEVKSGRINPLSFGRLSAVALLFGALLSIPHYLALTSLYTVGGGMSSFEDRLTTARKAFLYDNWVMFYTLSALRFEDVDANPSLLPMLARNVRFFGNIGTFSAYALALADAGRYDLAQRVLFGISHLDPHALAPLQAYCQTHPGPVHDKLLSMLRNPTPPSVSARDFP